jgi:hypothetical protein
MNLKIAAPIRIALIPALFSMAGSFVGGCGSDAPSSREQPSLGEPASGAPHPPPPPPPRPQTKEACDACGGLWAVHGIVPSESCICPTSDGGERCLDGRECEGLCLVNDEDAFQVTDETQPPRGFFTGTCAFYDVTFGCHHVIPSGTEDNLPLPADEAKLRLCVD